MSVPNYAQAVRFLFDSGKFDVTTHDGAGKFTETAVEMLHAMDANFGHLRKHGAQNQYNGHAVDVALYRATGQTVDFISSAGGPDAKIIWQVNEGDHYPESEWYVLEPGAAPVVTEPAALPLVDLISINDKLVALTVQADENTAKILDAITRLRQEAVDAGKNLQAQLPGLLKILGR